MKRCFGNLLIVKIAAAIFAAAFSVPVFAMDAPGSGGKGWKYSQQDYHWYYCPDGKMAWTGWLNHRGEWYWMDDQGRMQGSGMRVIDGKKYCFFVNGHMVWNQYLGLHFYNEQGQRDSSCDIRVIGPEKPTSEDRDLLTDDLYEIPRSWLARFTEDGWQFMFYKKKPYFSAPNTGSGIYYVYHHVDTHYKKVKFTETAAITQAFGEYVGYAAGCYREGSTWMEQIWEDSLILQNILEIPDYYANNAKFYFGKVFAGYLDGKTRAVMEAETPKVCEVMDEILWLWETPDMQELLRKERDERKEERRQKKEDAARAEGYGPGYRKNMPEEDTETGENPRNEFRDYEKEDAKSSHFS